MQCRNLGRLFTMKQKLHSRKPFLIQLSVFLVYFILLKVLHGIVGSFASVSTRVCSQEEGNGPKLIQQYENQFLPSAVILSVQTTPSSLTCGMACQRKNSCNAFHFKKQSPTTNNCALMKIGPKETEWKHTLIADPSGTLFRFIQRECEYIGSWGLLRHSAGLCVNYNQTENKIQLDGACDQKFQLENNRVYMKGSSQCLKPAGASYHSKIILSNECNDALSELVQLDSNLLYNPMADMCIHPYEGSSNPSPGTGLVVHPACADEARLHFNFEI